MSKSSALRREFDAPQPASQPGTADRTKEFLAELTELSVKHGIGITGAPVLFLMEQEDFAATYTIDAESNLSLGGR